MNIKTKLIFVVFLIIMQTLSPSAVGEIIYQNKSELINDQLFISDQDLKYKNDQKSIHLKSLRNITSKNSKEAEIAIKNLYQLKNDGLLDAEYSLYALKNKLSIPDEIALNFLEESARNGYSISQLELANIYYKGEKVKKDLAKYHEWVEKAANSGNKIAMRENAINYFTGTGVEKNDEEGFLWINKLYTSSGRDFDDWGLLGKVYETGRGTPINLIKAYMCYDLEGTAGIEEKARIAPQMTPEQRAEGLRLSREWQEKNHVYTMQSLGLSRQKDSSYR